jgi:sugar lactone lactonase YvrE
MRTIARTLGAAGLGLLAATAAAPQDFVELFNASQQARAAKDYAAMERSLQEALKVRPAHPRALYELAAAQALRGERKAALDTLESLADMGLWFDAAGDADFAALRESGNFKDVLEDFEENRRPQGRASPLLRLNTPTFIPEGVAYDEDTGAYYISGAHERRIARIPRSGQPEDFVPPGGGGLLAPLGIFADSRRRLLWVTSSGIPEMKNAQPDELGRAAILAFDLESGQVKRRITLKEPGEHLFGDLLVTRKGPIYVTDSKAGVLWSIDSSTGKAEALTAPGALASPQGIAATRDNRVLYIADYTQGLFYFDIGRRKLQRMEVARGISVYGIDGLYRYQDDLIAVQNGIRPHRVVRFELDDRGRRVRHARVLAASLPDFDEPTLGVLVGNRFAFVANSQWNRFDKNHQLPPNAQLRPPIVLRLTLEDSAERDRDLEPRQRGVPPPPPQQSPQLPLPRICAPGGC